MAERDGGGELGPIFSAVNVLADPESFSEGTAGISLPGETSAEATTKSSTDSPAISVVSYRYSSIARCCILHLGVDTEDQDRLVHRRQCGSEGSLSRVSSLLVLAQ